MRTTTLRYISLFLVVLLSFFVENSFGQRVKMEKLRFRNGTYPMLLLLDSSKTTISTKNSVFSKIINSIDKSNASFEIRSYSGLPILKNSGYIVSFKIIKDTGFVELTSFDISINRKSTLFPDSIGLTADKKIIQRKVYSQKLDDSSTKKILTDFLDIYTSAMEDQTAFQEKLIINAKDYNNPCKGITDCSDALSFYELKVNSSIRNFNRVGLNYYKRNKQLVQLKNNPVLQKIFYYLGQTAIFTHYRLGSWLHEPKCLIELGL